MRLALLFILVGIAHAQAPLTIDLSGEWRYSDGDDARYARPDFEDSAWTTVRVPGTNFLREQYRDPAGTWVWLRKTVVLPEGVERQRYSLMLGKLTENYDVFLNGVPVGRIGDFTVEGSQFARPQVLDLPVLAAGRATIAIRAWIHAVRGASTSWRVATDPGPYQLTLSEATPRTSGTAFVNNLRLARTLDLVAGVALVSLALIPFLMFLGQRKRMELLWLALHALFVGVRRLHLVLSIYPESRPWTWQFSFNPIHSACLLEFVMAAIGMRNVYLRAAIWGSAVWSFVDPIGFRMLEAVYVLVLVAAARHPFERPKEKYLIVAGATAIFFALARQDSPTPWMEATLPSAVLRIGPYNISLHSPLTAVLTLVMILVLTRRLLNDAREKQRMQGELEAARIVQRILVKNAGSVDGFEIDASYVPAQEVGGDFYQVVSNADGSALVVVGDVSGKGMSAAMVVSMLSGAIANRHAQTPAALLTELNQVLCSHFDRGFVTALCLLFAPGRVVAASAGHPAPYCDGKEAPVVGGLPLGVVPDVSYDEVVLSGTQFTVVSDGVVEAANARGELFGFDRTRELSGKAARAIGEAAKAWGQNDDITVVTVRRNG